MGLCAVVLMPTLSGVVIDAVVSVGEATGLAVVGVVVAVGVVMSAGFGVWVLGNETQEKR